MQLVRNLVIIVGRAMGKFRNYVEKRAGQKEENVR